MTTAIGAAVRRALDQMPDPGAEPERRQVARERAVTFVQQGLQHEWYGRLQAAELAYRRAVAADGSFDAPRHLLGMQLLGRGDFERGFQLVQARLERVRAGREAGGDGYEPPLWRGETLRGQSILVVFEQGFGDQIMYARFLPALKERGAQRVAVLAPRPLARLFERVAGVDEVIPADKRHGDHQVAARPIYPTHFWTPIASLPYVLQVRVETIPAPPYLSADHDAVEHWRPRLPQAPGLRIGLVWRGDPKHMRDSCRSLPSLSTLAPLWRVPGVSFVSLQVGAAEDEARRGMPGMPMLHLGSELRDFGDTAAILSQLDLLVSVDTSTANLAGALGLPVWLLLDAVPDWRWRCAEASRRWYPSVRGFRQEQLYDWRAPVEAVATALEAAAATV